MRNASRRRLFAWPVRNGGSAGPRRSASRERAAGVQSRRLAIGILAATGQVPMHRLHEYEFAGELSLAGELRPIRGALAMTLKACGDKRAFVLPKSSAIEAALVRNAVVLPAQSLVEVCAHLLNRGALQQQLPAAFDAVPTGEGVPDLGDVKGQPHAKRALEIAAAGQHSLLMMCPINLGPSSADSAGFRGTQYPDNVTLYTSNFGSLRPGIEGHTLLML